MIRQTDGAEAAAIILVLFFRDGRHRDAALAVVLNWTPSGFEPEGKQARSKSIPHRGIHS
jgi:hypothetical protein